MSLVIEVCNSLLMYYAFCFIFIGERNCSKMLFHVVKRHVRSDGNPSYEQEYHSFECSNPSVSANHMIIQENCGKQMHRNRIMLCD